MKKYRNTKGQFITNRERIKRLNRTNGLLIGIMLWGFFLVVAYELMLIN
jgi:hypothetical protein